MSAVAFLPHRTYHLQPETEFRITGTSSLHDWEITTDKASGSSSMHLNGNQITDVSSLQFTIPAKSFKSGKKAMDENTYKALKASEFPNIKFSISNVKIAQKEGNEASFSGNGNLTVAGVSQVVQIDATGRVDGGKIYFEGKKDLKLTDFNIDPPTAMLGTIKTGNEITIHYKAVF